MSREVNINYYKLELSNEKERGEDKVKDYVKEIYEDKER